MAAKDKQAIEEDLARKKKREEKELDKFLLDADKEAEKMCKEIWTKDVIEEHGENLQKLLKEGSSNLNPNPSKELQPWQILRN